MCKVSTLIKKKTKFSSHIRKDRKERLQSQPPHIWLNICAFPHILGILSKSMTLQPLPSEFPYIWGKFIFFFISVVVRLGLRSLLYKKNFLDARKSFDQSAPFVIAKNRQKPVQTTCHSTSFIIRHLFLLFTTKMSILHFCQFPVENVSRGLAKNGSYFGQ